MSTFYPAPNVVQCEIIWDKSGQKVENVWHFRVSAEPTEVQYQNLFTRITNYITAHWVSALPADVKLVGLRAFYLGNQNSPVSNYTGTALGTTGTIANASLPNSVTFALKFGIPRRGRGLQGRMFWPGLAQAMLSDDNHLQQGYADQIKGYIQEVFADVGGQSFPFVACVVHSKLNTAFLNPRTNDLITSVTYTDLVLDSQRTRMPGKRRAKRKHQGTP